MAAKVREFRNRRSAMKWARSICLLAVTGTLLTGCGKNMYDLEQYVDEVKSRKPAGIESVPQPKPYVKFEYQAANRRDPFDASVLAASDLVINKRPTSEIYPNANRPIEFLESFPLDTLRMVGTMEQEEQLWALIQTPDTTIQRVSPGNHLGQNYGKINAISEYSIDLTEIIPDGFGGWRKRNQTIALSE